MSDVNTSSRLTSAITPAAIGFGRHVPSALLGAVATGILLLQLGVVQLPSHPTPTAASTPKTAQADDFHTLPPSAQGSIVLMQANMAQMDQRISGLVSAQEASHQRQLDFEVRLTGDIERRMDELTRVIAILASEPVSPSPDQQARHAR